MCPQSVSLVPTPRLQLQWYDGAQALGSFSRRVILEDKGKNAQLKILYLSVVSCVFFVCVSVSGSVVKPFSSIFLWKRFLDTGATFE
jgi:hypothetical protein